MLTLILTSGLMMGLKPWSIWIHFKYKDFIQINKSNEFIEINVSPYNKQLLKKMQILRLFSYSQV